MGPLIVMDVHARDVIGDMVKKGVKEATTSTGSRRCATTPTPARAASASR